MIRIHDLQTAFEVWAVIFALIAGICVFATRSTEREAAVSLIWMLAVVAVMNIADILFKNAGAFSGSGYHLFTRKLPLTVYLCGFVFIPLFAWHTARVIVVRGGKAERKLSVLTVALSGAGILLVILSQAADILWYFDEQNRLIRRAAYPLLIIPAELALFPVLIRIIRNRKSLRPTESAAFGCNWILMAAGFVLHLFVTDIDPVIIAYVLTLIIIVMTHQMEFSRDNLARERMLARTQVQLYTRQIQPHFIYNSLSAIRSTLPEDSEARERLNHFSGFLRGSIDLLTTENCVRASREFATVRDYLYMEKARFGDALTVVDDIQDEDYDLPPFTVQTLVENAIRCGIRENPGGKGTLTIRSYTEAGTHVIEVTDDGVGFDPEARTKPDDDRPHIGLSNIRERLKLMCGGSLSIRSTPGKGTRARVEIPAGGERRP